MHRTERSAGFVLFRRAAQPSVGFEYLLLDYGRHWDFPKGHVEKGEDELAAAWRELAEETGVCEARLVEGFRREIVYFFRGRKRGLIRKTVTFFLAETASEGIVLSDEHVGYAYLPFERALERVTFSSARQVLKDADALLRPVVTGADRLP